MKNIFVTIIVGFIAGLILSGVIADAYFYVARSLDRFYIARTVAKAEKMVAEDNCEKAIELYEKAFARISSAVNDDKNTTLIAKIKNNQGLCFTQKFEKYGETADFTEALALFKEALGIYKKIQKGELADQTEQNIKALEEIFKNK